MKHFDIVLGDENTAFQPPYYICPLSLEVFLEDSLNLDVLTQEHVPPDSLGGKPICLTSKTSNNGASDLDSMLKNRHESLLLYKTEKKTTAYGYLHTDEAPGKGKKVKIHTFRENNKLVLQYIVSKQLASYVRSNVDMFTKGATSTLNFEIIDINTSPKLRAAYIKNAYLKAFAHFGYGFILGEMNRSDKTHFCNKSIQTVRESLSLVDCTTLGNISIKEDIEEWPTSYISIASTRDGSNRYLAVPLDLEINQKQRAVVFFHEFGGVKSTPLHLLGQHHSLDFTECPRHIDLTTEVGALWFWRKTID